MKSNAFVKIKDGTILTCRLNGLRFPAAFVRYIYDEQSTKLCKVIAVIVRKEDGTLERIENGDFTSTNVL